MHPEHRSSLSVVLMGSSCRITLLGSSCELLVETGDEPRSILHRNVVAFPVAESHVIHEKERLLEVVFPIVRRQAKKSLPQAGFAPPTAHCMMGSQALPSCRYQAHWNRYDDGAPWSRGLACF